MEAGLAKEQLLRAQRLLDAHCHDQRGRQRLTPRGRPSQTDHERRTELRPDIATPVEGSEVSDAGNSAAQDRRAWEAADQVGDLLDLINFRVGLDSRDERRVLREVPESIVEWARLVALVAAAADRRDAEPEQDEKSREAPHRVRG